MNIKELFNQWQTGIENIHSEKEEESLKPIENDQLYEVAGVQVRSRIVAGQLFSLLTICRCED